MNNDHQNNNDEQLAQSPLKLPRETNKDINTSPVKQQVNRNQIIGRPIEIIKGKFIENIVCRQPGNRWSIASRPNHASKHIDIFKYSSLSKIKHYSWNHSIIFTNGEGRTPLSRLAGCINILGRLDLSPLEVVVDDSARQIKQGTYRSLLLRILFIFMAFILPLLFFS